VISDLTHPPLICWEYCDLRDPGWLNLLALWVHV